ncbi:hypothetical protein MSHOH_2317 [Methanosarcina horonobensis HB-1 = JCM 15518]|uniref:Uncharacterized protein n=1 Tax=Methanosarcina horonobensis HB-1 = JCM 15518 TaxID=1434110 RepID=A0A0E3WVZ9_9EURY|nr:hypothetical protein [Methanosarcina horonobensis]AKB78800.1 hypothetical protein MSHOH_2317 [Methanosarcina horonobensis HB-1 = JCM 15518]
MLIIPEDIRVNCLLKGLSEKKNPYYILASVVGLQGIDTRKKINNRAALQTKKKKKKRKRGSLKTTEISYQVVPD